MVGTRLRRPPLSECRLVNRADSGEGLASASGPGGIGTVSGAAIFRHHEAEIVHCMGVITSEECLSEGHVDMILYQARSGYPRTLVMPCGTGCWSVWRSFTKLFGDHIPPVVAFAGPDVFW